MPVQHVAFQSSRFLPRVHALSFYAVCAWGACVDELCRSATLEVPAPEDGPFTGITGNDLTLMTDTDTILLTLPEGDWSGRHEVSIVVRDASGQVIDRGGASPEFLGERPNGPQCPPTCWRATVVI